MARDEQHTGGGRSHGGDQPDLEPAGREARNRRNRCRDDAHDAHRNPGNPGNRKRASSLDRGADIVESSESVTVDSNGIVRSWVAHIGPTGLLATLGRCSYIVKYFALRSDVSQSPLP